MIPSVPTAISRIGRVIRGIRTLPAKRSLLLSLCMNGKISAAESAAVRGTTVLHILRFLCCADLPISFRSGLGNTGWALRNIGYYPQVTMSPVPAEWFPWDLSVGDASAPAPPRTGSRWDILYDYRPGLELGKTDYVMPYGIHPAHIHTAGLNHLPSLLPALRQTVRTGRLFFAGTMSRFYTKNSILRGCFGKMDRCDILSIARSTHHFQQTGTSTDHVSKVTGGRFVLLDSSIQGIPLSQWFSTVSQFDFMLCPPGVIMPMCHNIIEAMAVGTIPLTNYPEWFFPPLRHGHECFAFSSGDELIARLEEIRTLPPSRIAAMRQACITYYDTHLDPKAVISRILDSGSSHVRLHVLDETVGSLGIPRPT
ncbi:MAG: glycosyltransferase [Planctomycetia bacterium]